MNLDHVRLYDVDLLWFPDTDQLQGYFYIKKIPPRKKKNK